MAKSVVNKFNRGEISTRAMARDDLDKVGNSCELMDNFIPVRLGPMQYRPGIEYIGEAEDPTNDQNRALIPHIRTVNDSVLYEFSGNIMRPLVNGLPVPVATTTDPVTNGFFTSNISGWASSGGAAWSSSYSGSVVLERGQSVTQTVTAAGIQCLRIVVHETPCRLKITGAETTTLTLHPGTTYYQFDPGGSGSYTVTLSSTDAEWGDGDPVSYVTTCAAQTSGNVQFSVNDLDYRVISHDSSADLMFLALGKNHSPKYIKRIGSDGSFAFGDYFFTNGPFESLNTSSVGVEASLAGGSTVITSDAPLFEPDRDVGRLIKIAYPERTVTFPVLAVSQSTEWCAMRGHGEEREMLVIITGTFQAVINISRYDPKTGGWVTTRTYSSATSDIIVDNFDGEYSLYKIVCTSYTSGIAIVQLKHVSTAVNGSAKITGFSGSSIVSAIVHKGFLLPGSTVTPSAYWQWGAWYPGAYPQGVTVYEGRVAWASSNRIDLTVVDDYYNFDYEIPGDSAAISRTIGFGPSEDISWMESSNRLYLGLPSTEVLVRTTGDDVPMTPLNVNLKPGKGLGSAPRRPVATDDELYFVSRDGKRVHALEYDNSQNTQGHSDQMLLHPEICGDGIAAMVITHHPEKRLWVATETGELRVLLMEPIEKVLAWSRVTVNGFVEDIAVLPATGEDELWLTIRRDGKSRICKMAQFGAFKPMDEFVEYTSPGTATLTGLDHLEGETVGVWADGQDRGDYVVSSGSITIDSDAYTSVVAGLRYTADYKSAKLGEYVTDSVLGEMVTVSNVSVILEDYAHGALKIGRDFDHLRDLAGAAGGGAIVNDYDMLPVSFSGSADTNSRVCMRATGPCVVKALVYDVNLRVGKDA